MSLLGRTQELHVHGPALLEKIIQLHMDVSESAFSYPFYFHPLPNEGKIADTASCEIFCFPVKHKIPCHGFLFKEKKKPRRIIADKVRSFGIPETFLEELKMGKDYIHPKGTVVSNQELTEAGDTPLRYAFCADTLFHEELAEYVRGVDLLYYETTYLKDQLERAEKHHHSTTEQAGRMAVTANAGQLLIGHFSSKYENLEPFLEETKAVFPNTILAIEGSCIKL